MRLAVCLAVLLSCQLIAAQAPDDRAELIQLEHLWLQAIQQHDTVFLNELLDDDFVDTAPDGHLRTKQDALAAPLAKDVESEDLRDLAVHLHGEVAVVTGIDIIIGKGKSYVATVHFTDVFHKSQGRWKAIAAQEKVDVKRQ